MKIEQNEDGKWCIYNETGEKLGEYESEDAAKEAMAQMSKEERREYTILAAVDLKEIVTRDLGAEVEIQLALPGHYIKGEREFDITLGDFADAERNFAAAANPLPVDYEHNTFVKGAEAPAAGWIKKVINRGERGLYAIVSWTQSAAEKIKRGEYRFISPVFFFEARDVKSGKPIGTILGPAALTNFPLIQGMQPVTAKRLDVIAKEKTMDWKKFLVALGVSVGEEDVSEEKALEMIKAKMVQAEPPKRPKGVVPASILEVLELNEGASESEARGAIMALKFPADSVPRERYEGLEAQLHERDVSDLIDRACRPGDSEMEGKLYPHEREWAIGEAKKDFDTMRAFIAKRPKVLALMAKLPSGKKDPARIDSTQEAINRQLGLKTETFLKYNTAH